MRVFSSISEVDVLVSPQQLEKLHTEVLHDDEIRYKHNAHVWDAIMRLLTREAGVVVEAADEDRLSAHYLGYDSLTDFLQVIYYLLSHTTGSVHHHLQRQSE